MNPQSADVQGSWLGWEGTYRTAGLQTTRFIVGKLRTCGRSCKPSNEATHLVAPLPRRQSEPRIRNLVASPQAGDLFTYHFVPAFVDPNQNRRLPACAPTTFKTPRTPHGQATASKAAHIQRPTMAARGNSLRDKQICMRPHWQCLCAMPAVSILTWAGLSVNQEDPQPERGC